MNQKQNVTEIEVIGLSYLSDHELDSNDVVGCAGSDAPMSITGEIPNR